jgi:hypothetical protein
MCRTPPRRASGREPAPAGPGLQVQGTELVDIQHTPVAWRVVVQVEDACHLHGEVDILAGLPRLGGLPAHARVPQDRAGRLGADPDLLLSGC